MFAKHLFSDKPTAATETSPVTMPKMYRKPCRHGLSYGNLKSTVFRWSVTCASRPNRIGRSHGIAALSRQLNVAVPVDGEAFLTGRTAERLRAEIRTRFGFREATISDAEMLTKWLRDHVAAEPDGEIESMIERLETRCRELAIEPPTADRMERIVRTALRTHEERFHADIYGRLSAAIRQRLDKLLRPAEGDSDSSSPDDMPGSAPAALLKLRDNSGRPTVASMKEELGKLDLIRRIELPADLFDHTLPRYLERCRRRVVVEAPHELRRHPDAARITWLAAFVYLRARSLTDDLVDRNHPSDRRSR